MEYKDYYQLLGLSREASADEIKKQYRRLARKYHPDVSDEKDAEEKFKEVKEAYEVLKDPKKRARYDQLGSQWQAGQGFEPPPDWQQYTSSAPFEEGQFSDFSDFFSSIFGQARRGRAGAGFQARGQDQLSKIDITLEEAYHGCDRQLQLRQSELDPKTGQLQVKSRSLKVKIPKGVTQGQQIRLSGQGGQGMGAGPSGDLYLEINLLPHATFTVDGKNIYLNLPITPWEAALGSKVTTPTLAGNVGLTIPAGSQTGQQLRLKGRGLPGTPSGDQFVLLKIYIPEPKTAKQRELYQQMAEDMEFNPREDLITRK